MPLSVFQCGGQPHTARSPSLRVPSAAVEKACLIRRAERGLWCSGCVSAREPTLPEQHGTSRETVGRGAWWAALAPGPLEDVGLHCGLSLTSQVTMSKALNLMTP